MKTLIAAILAAGVLAIATAANAQSNPFTDPSIALPHSQGYEQALPRAGADDYRQALPRGGNDEHRDALPLTHETFGDIVVATP